MSHWHPLRCREKSVLRTSRMSTVRGCPPRGLCLAGGISGATMVHGSSVRSEGYCFRAWSFFFIRAHSSAGEMCANSLTNRLFCQALFPDSLLQIRVLDDSGQPWRIAVNVQSDTGSDVVLWVVDPLVGTT